MFQKVQICGSAILQKLLREFSREEAVLSCVLFLCQHNISSGAFFYNFYLQLLLWSGKPEGMAWWHNHIWQFRFVCILFPYSAKKKQVKAISQILAFSLSKWECNWQIKENNFEGCNSWLLCVQASSKFLKDEWSKLQLLQSICVIRKVHPKS